MQKIVHSNGPYFPIPHFPAKLRKLLHHSLITPLFTWCYDMPHASKCLYTSGGIRAGSWLASGASWWKPPLPVTLLLTSGMFLSRDKTLSWRQQSLRWFRREGRDNMNHNHFIAPKMHVMVPHALLPNTNCHQYWKNSKNVTCIIPSSQTQASDHSPMHHGPWKYILKPEEPVVSEWICSSTSNLRSSLRRICH